MVNKKFIVPWGCRITYGGRVSFGEVGKMNDITKALCNLMGKSFEDIESMYDLENRMWFGTWFEWGFFRIKCFKKGTIHFEFLDEEVWYKFNQTVAKSRGWSLPTMSNTTKKEKRYRKSAKKPSQQSLALAS